MPKFRIACHVCTYGELTNAHTAPVFRQIAEAGYEGVEGMFFDSAEDLVQTAALARSYGLHIVMAHARTPAQVIRYNAALGNRSCEVWEMLPGDFGWPGISKEELFTQVANYFRPYMAEAARHGMKLHHHVHLGQVMQTMDDVDLMMRHVPEMGILLDTGHLAAAGGNAADLLSKYGDKVMHVHLKDFYQSPSWDVNHMQFDENYFVPLGQGNSGVDVGAILKTLEDIGYDGWVSAELDYMGPLKANAVPVGQLIKENREYLRSIGY